MMKGSMFRLYEISSAQRLGLDRVGASGVGSGQGQGLRGRVWTGSGPQGSGLDRVRAEKWPKPEREAFLGRGQGRKVVKTRAGERSERGLESRPGSRAAGQ